MRYRLLETRHLLQRLEHLLLPAERLVELTLSLSFADRRRTTCHLPLVVPRIEVVHHRGHTRAIHYMVVLLLDEGVLLLLLLLLVLPPVLLIPLFDELLNKVHQSLLAFL